MFDLDKMLGNKKKSKKKSDDIFNMDKIIPKRNESFGRDIGNINTDKVIKDQMPKIPNNAKIVINNYYTNTGQRQQQPQQFQNKKYLSALESFDSRGMPIRMPKGFQDMDRDGVPARLDPDDFDPNTPRPMTTQSGSKRVNKIMRDMLGDD